MKRVAGEDDSLSVYEEPVIKTEVKPSFAEQQLRRNAIMNRDVLKQRLRVKLADRGFHNAGNQRFAPVDNQQKNKDIDELDKCSNEIVRAMMRQLLEEYFKQQKQRTHAMTLRQEAVAKFTGMTVSHTVRHEGRDNLPPSDENLKLLVSDTPWRHNSLL